MRSIVIIVLAAGLAGCIGATRIESSTSATRNTSAYQGNCAPALALAVDRTDPSDVFYPDLVAAESAWTLCINDPVASASIRSPALRTRAAVYARKREYLRAIEDYENAFKIVPPATGREVLSLANLYRETGQSDRALELIHQMQVDRLGLSGKGTAFGMPTYYFLGWVLCDVRQWSEAIDALTVGLSYQPDYGWAFLRRAVAYEALRDATRAQADTDRGVALLRGVSRAMKPAALAESSRRLAEPAFAALLTRYGYPANPLTIP